MENSPGNCVRNGASGLGCRYDWRIRSSSSSSSLGATHDQPVTLDKRPSCANSTRLATSFRIHFLSKGADFLPNDSIRAGVGPQAMHCSRMWKSLIALFLFAFASSLLAEQRPTAYEAMRTLGTQ